MLNGIKRYMLSAIIKTKHAAIPMAFIEIREDFFILGSASFMNFSSIKLSDCNNL